MLYFLILSFAIFSFKSITAADPQTTDQAAYERIATDML